MLHNLEPTRVPIKLCGKELYLRYDLNSQLYLEHYYGEVDLFLDKDMDSWSIGDAVHLLRAGLMDCYFKENEDAISQRRWDDVKPSLAGLGRMVERSGLPDITMTIIGAIVASLPEVVEGAEPNFQTGAG